MKPLDEFALRTLDSPFDYTIKLEHFPNLKNLLLCGGAIWYPKEHNGLRLLAYRYVCPLLLPTLLILFTVLQQTVCSVFFGAATLYDAMKVVGSARNTTVVVESITTITPPTAVPVLYIGIMMSVIGISLYGGVMQVFRSPFILELIQPVHIVDKATFFSYPLKLSQIFTYYVYGIYGFSCVITLLTWLGMSVYLAVYCNSTHCAFDNASVLFSGCKTFQMLGMLIAIHLYSLGAGLDILLCKLLKMKIRENKEWLSLNTDLWLTDHERILDTLNHICTKLQYAHLGAFGAATYCIFTGVSCSFFFYRSLPLLWYLTTTPDLLTRFVNVPLYSLLASCLLVNVLLFSFSSVTAECDSMLQYARRFYKKQQTDVEGLILYLSTDHNVGYKIFNTTVRYAPVQILCFFVASVLIFLLSMTISN